MIIQENHRMFIKTSLCKTWKNELQEQATNLVFLKNEYTKILLISLHNKISQNKKQISSYTVWVD